MAPDRPTGFRNSIQNSSVLTFSWIAEQEMTNSIGEANNKPAVELAGLEKTTKGVTTTHKKIGNNFTGFYKGFPSNNTPVDIALLEKVMKESTNVHKTTNKNLTAVPNYNTTAKISGLKKGTKVATVIHKTTKKRGKQNKK